MIKDNIKAVCKDRGISISRIEKDLGYGNGSIMKGEGMSGKRLAEVAHYLGITADELYEGITPHKELKSAESSSDPELLKKQVSLLEQIVAQSSKINDLYGEIDSCRDKIKSLQEEYNNL